MLAPALPRGQPVSSSTLALGKGYSCLSPHCGIVHFVPVLIERRLHNQIDPQLCRCVILHNHIVSLYPLYEMEKG